MKDKTKGLIVGLSIGLLFSGVTAYADYSISSNETAWFKPVNIFVDGKRKTSDEILIYNDKAFVPVRSFSKSIGKTVEPDFSRNNMYIGTSPTTKGITSEEAMDLLMKKYKFPDHTFFNMDRLDENGNYVFIGYSHLYVVIISLYYTIYSINLGDIEIHQEYHLDILADSLRFQAIYTLHR